MAGIVYPARERRAGLRSRAAAAVVVGLVVVAGCGSDGDTDVAADADEPRAFDADVSEVVGSDGTIDCPAQDATSGDGVRVGIVATTASTGMELDAAAQAAAAYANECLGGIAGHPLDLVFCGSTADTVENATACAEELVDSDVDVALVTLTSQGDALVPVLTGAGIPYLVSGGTSASESNDEDDLVFSLTSGGAGAMAAMASYAADNGIENVAIVVSELAAGGLGQLANIPFAVAGVHFEVRPIAAGETDMTELVQGLPADTGALAILADAETCGTLMEAASTLAPDAVLMIVATCLRPSVVEGLGSEVIDGAVMFGNYDPFSEDPEAVLYREVMAAYAPETAADGLTVTGYQVVIGLVRATAGLEGDVDREAITEAMRSSADVPMPAGAGSTFGCSSDPIPLISASCSGDALVFTLDGATPTDPQVIDISPLYSR